MVTFSSINKNRSCERVKVFIEFSLVFVAANTHSGKAFVIITTVYPLTPRVPPMATTVHCAAVVGAVLRRVAVCRAGTKTRLMSGRVIVGYGWFWLREISAMRFTCSRFLRYGISWL